MKRGGCLAAGVLALVLLVAAAIVGVGWWGASELRRDTSFTVPSGSSLTSVARKLEDEQVIASADAFLLRAKFFASSDPVRAGEFLLPAAASPATILDIMQHGESLRRFVTVPEGMPSILVHERLMAEKLLTGTIPVPAEGSILPDTYDFERGESRSAVVARMTAAMDTVVKDLWAKRARGIAVTTPQQALTLASIVEKETGVARERRMVAGLYSNRLRQGMMLQADPTIIYPITRGKPLGRRILRSEITAVNDYNTYSMAGLPIGPITNPGRESIAAVLNPASTDALYMVADGTGGHAFAATLDQHNANVAKWFAIRRARGDL